MNIYEDFVFFAEVDGCGTVLCFRNMASYIINDKWYSEKKEDIQEEAERVVIAAAKIRRAEIRERKYDSNSPMKIFLVLIKAGSGSHTICKHS